MKNLIFLAALMGLLIANTQAQTTNSRTQKNQKAMKYYKKKMEPQGEQFLTSAPLKIEQKITINAPVSKVWKVIDNTPKFIEWFPGVKWGKMEIESEKGLGAKRLAQLDGNKYYEEIIAYEVEKSWGITMIESTTGMLSSITEVFYLEAIDKNTTNVVFKGGYAPKGMAKLMKGIIANTINKTWDNALNGLKTHVENLD